MFKQSEEDRQQLSDEMTRMKTELSSTLGQVGVDGKFCQSETEIQVLEGKLKCSSSALKQLEKDKLAVVSKIEVLEMKLKKDLMEYSGENIKTSNLEEVEILLELSVDVLNRLEVKKTLLDMELKALDNQLRLARDGLSSMKEDERHLEGTNRLPGENTREECKTIAQEELSTEGSVEERPTVLKEKHLPQKLETSEKLQCTCDETSYSSVIVEASDEREVQKQSKEDGNLAFEVGRSQTVMKQLEVNDEAHQHQREVGIQLLNCRLRQCLLDLERVDLEKISVTLKITELERRIGLELDEKLSLQKRHMEELEVCLESSVNNLNQLEEEKNRIKKKVKDLEDQLRLTRYQSSGKVYEKEVKGTKELPEIQWKVPIIQEELITKCHVNGTMHHQELKKIQKDASVDHILSALPRNNSSPDLEADYGKLVVEVARDLTLDNTLLLAQLFGLSVAETDIIRRISFCETPGIKCLEFLKEHEFINKYNVTNLQNALELLDMKKTNNVHVIPYQKKIDSSKYKLHHPVPKIISLAGIHSAVDAVKTKTKNNKPQIRTSSEDVEGMWLLEEAREQRDTLDVRKQENLGSVHAGNRSSLPYVEEEIGFEGGTIHAAGISFSLPPGALSNYHMIALTVGHHPGMNLPENIEKSGMITLVQLEPPGLMFDKPGNLSIQHLGFFPEGQHLMVSIYSGQKSVMNETEIMWKTEESLNCKINKKTVDISLHSLSYLCACLGRKDTAQKVIMRAVAFVNGVLEVNDDIIFTVCFCKDIDAEYQLLLSDYKSKLKLEGYTTLCLRQNVSRVEPHEGFVDLAISSVDSSYLPLTKQKRIASDHICSASRVSHQFRLTKNNNANSDQVNVKLTISQDGGGETEIHFKEKVKYLQVLEDTPPAPDAYNGTVGHDCHGLYTCARKHWKEKPPQRLRKKSMGD